MSHYAFSFHGETLHALASGGLFWPARELLCVSDLHFGKAQRYALLGASGLPPYETRDTLVRLDHDIAQTCPKTIICLGDSFDRIGANAELDETARDWITRLQAGRKWIWIEGNHDPGPIGLGGSHLADHAEQPLTFRHIAETNLEAAGEISGHYHPKVTIRSKGRAITRHCFVFDDTRLILPAYGTYTGGLSVVAKPIARLVKPNAVCIMTGKTRAARAHAKALK